MRNKFKSQRLPKGINPVLLDKDLVERMCAKSSMLFGVKWRWRVMCGRNNIDPVELEKRFDMVIEQQFKNIKEQTNNEQSSTDQQLGTNDRGSSTDGSGEKERALSGDAGQSQSEDNTGKGKEVRQRKTDDESVTTRGTE